MLSFILTVLFVSFTYYVAKKRAKVLATVKTLKNKLDAVNIPYTDILPERMSGTMYTIPIDNMSKYAKELSNRYKLGLVMYMGRNVLRNYDLPALGDFLVSKDFFIIQSRVAKMYRDDYAELFCNLGIYLMGFAADLKTLGRSNDETSVISFVEVELSNVINNVENNVENMIKKSYLLGLMSYLNR